MTEDKETLMIRSQLMEALKDTPLYKDPKSNKAVMKEPEDPTKHSGISDFLLRVLDQKTIDELDYHLGFDPERQIHQDVIPNKNKKKFKEAVELTELDQNENFAKRDLASLGDNQPLTKGLQNAGVETPSSNNNTSSNPFGIDIPDNTSATNNSDMSNLSSPDETEDSLNNDESAETSDELDNNESSDDVDDTTDVEDNSQGLGAFDRIVQSVSPEDILMKAISALNKSSIEDAKDEFYGWFDTFDDAHKKDDMNVNMISSEDASNQNMNSASNNSNSNMNTNSNMPEPSNNMNSNQKDEEEDDSELADMLGV